MYHFSLIPTVLLLLTCSRIEPLGSSDPCEPSHLFDYDVFQLKSTCTAVSLFIEKGDDDQHLDDEPGNQQKLLNPCRPGVRKGNNLKCFN